MIEMNPALTEIDIAVGAGGAEGFTLAAVVKLQPPDGLVLELEDGSHWAVAAYRLKGFNGEAEHMKSTYPGTDSARLEDIQPIEEGEE